MAGLLANSVVVVVEIRVGPAVLSTGQDRNAEDMRTYRKGL